LHLKHIVSGLKISINEKCLLSYRTGYRIIGLGRRLNMLTKVNELSKNAIILLSVGIIAITSIVVTLIATGEGSRKGSAEPLVEF
jgi:hypothetical protein